MQRWRLRQLRSHRFDTLISVQEVLALQDLGRWQEADVNLAVITGAETADLRIARLASALDRAPGSDELALKPKQAIDDPGCSARRRLVLMLMAAEAAAFRRNEHLAAHWRTRAFSGHGAGQVAQVVTEQQPRLGRILSSRPLRTELRRLPKLNRVLKQLPDKTAPALPEGLTRQEHRVLLLLAESQPNKMIAQRPGISLATVEFHVSNLLTKAKVRNRKALVHHGLSVGWLSDD